MPGPSLQGQALHHSLHGCLARARSPGRWLQSQEPGPKSCLDLHGSPSPLRHSPSASGQEDSRAGCPCSPACPQPLLAGGGLSAGNRTRAPSLPPATPLPCQRWEPAGHGSPLTPPPRPGIQEGCLGATRLPGTSSLAGPMPEEQSGTAHGPSLGGPGGPPPRHPGVPRGAGDPTPGARTDPPFLAVSPSACVLGARVKEGVRGSGLQGGGHLASLPRRPRPGPLTSDL